MPYTIRKRSCRQSSGKKGTHTLSYIDKHGKKHSNCHTSKKKAQGQIGAIEGPKESVVRMVVREMIRDIAETTYATRSTYFRNPYECPGEEFEVDAEDPVGLVKLQDILDNEDEIRGITDGRD